MPRKSTGTPAHRLHRPSGRAVVTLGRKDFYLGAHGSEESRREYDRLIAEWLANGRRPVGEPLLVKGLVRRHLEAIEGQYSSNEPEAIAAALAVVFELYGDRPVESFGPLALEAVRDRIIANGHVLEAIRAGLAAIARVHDVVLPETFAGGAGAGMRPTALGRFRPGNQPGADRIEVRGGLRSTAFTFLHEFGHLVDARGPARHASPGSAPDPAWASWWKAIVETRRMAELLARREGAALEGSTKRTERLDYLLRPREIWARAYAQWIVTRSGDDAAGRAFFERLRIDPDYNANWWEDDDFEPVALAIDAVFRKLGWLKS